MLIRLLFIFSVVAFISIGSVSAKTADPHDVALKTEDLLAVARSVHLPDSTRFQAYIDIASALIELPQLPLPVTLKELLEEGLKTAIQLKKEDEWLNYVDEKGKYERMNYQYDKAIFWYRLQNEWADSLGILHSRASALNNLGLIYRRNDDYPAAIDSYQQALKIADETNNYQAYVFATNGLGNIYLELENLTEAMYNFRLCLRMEQSLNNLVGVAINLNNIGHVYAKSGEHEKALDYFMLSLEVNREIGSQRGIAICYTDIGDVYRARGENDKALNYYQMSASLCEAINELYYLAISYLRMAELYAHQEATWKAMEYAGKAIELSQQTRQRSNLANAFQLMYQLQRKHGNIQKAIEFLEKATALNDSILNESTQHTIFQMQATFNREMANNQITMLQNEREIARLQIKKQKAVSNLVVSGLFILIIGLVTLFWILRLKARANRTLLTKNKEIEEARIKLSESNQQLLLAKQEAERSNQLKSQFLANMSHEIRTPMNSVIGFTELLSKLLTDPKHLRYLDSIQYNGRVLLELIDDILDLSRIEAGKAEKAVLHPVDIPMLFRRIAEVFSLQASRQELQFEFECSPDVPEFILMNESGIRQVLFNLVANAIKFTPNGIIRLTADAVQFTQTKCSLTIAVEDNGQGIREKDQLFVFEAFYQASDNRFSQKGTGLGLAITKRLVETMNGSITLNSTYGQGTTFTIYFPELAIVSLQSALRLIEAEESGSTSTAQICMISKNMNLNHFVDSLLRETGKLCDLYEFIDRMTIFDNEYQIVLWDADMIKSFIHNQQVPAFISSNPSQQHIVLYNTTDTKFTEGLPGLTSYSILKDKVKIKDLLTTKELSDNKSEESLLKEDMFAKQPITPELIKLIEDFHQVQQTNVIQEIRLFATHLAHYGEKAGWPFMSDTGRQLIEAADSFDIVHMGELMDQIANSIKHIEELHATSLTNPSHEKPDKP
ncbi:MAG: tetratricopeptide repeat-containing sensor histidine kinase [Bacteroidales bacterium]|nr:tetratricopeptide repeat-containing sensor histidine kinase [Bacteroidales bacterium]